MSLYSNPEMYDRMWDDFAYDICYAWFNTKGKPKETRDEYHRRRRMERANEKTFWEQHAVERKVCEELQKVCTALRHGLVITAAQEKARKSIEWEKVCLQEESWDVEDHRPGEAEWVLVPCLLTNEWLGWLADAWRAAVPGYQEKKAYPFPAWLKGHHLASYVAPSRIPRMYEY